MRKILFVLSSFMLCNAVFAKNTCETRVDAHPTATTLQRIAYCLNDQTVNVAADSNAGLVFSEVSAPYSPAAAQPAQKPTTREEYFKGNKVTVSRDYVATGQFPQLTQGPGAALPGQAPVVHQMAEEVGPVVASANVATVETSKGIKARQTKPARQWKAAAVQKTPAQEPSEPEEQPVAVEEVTALTTVDPYAPVENMYEELPQEPVTPMPAQ